VFRRTTASRPPVALALDLGTARTRVAVPGQGIWLDEPTLLALDRHGAPAAAGWQAWHAAVDGPVALRYPVRQAHVVHPVLCVSFLRMLLEQAGLTGAELVAVSVPAQSLTYDVDVLAGCVGAATGARTIRVDAAVACVQALDADLAPQLVVDVGAGICEVSAVWDGHAQAQGRADIGAPEYLIDPARLVPPVMSAVRSVLADVPTGVATVLRSRPLQLVGGGTLMPGLQHDLREVFEPGVAVPAEPRDCLITGLSRHLTAATAA
jgi:rod shape-determining protein MreB